MDGLRPIERKNFELPMLFQVKYARSTRSMSPFGTPAVVPSMLSEVGCPLKTCTPVESPNTLYMLSRAVTLRFSVSCESSRMRNRFV